MKKKIVPLDYKYDFLSWSIKIKNQEWCSPKTRRIFFFQLTLFLLDLNGILFRPFLMTMAAGPAIPNPNGAVSRSNLRNINQVNSLLREIIARMIAGLAPGDRVN